MDIVTLLVLAIRVIRVIVGACGDNNRTYRVGQQPGEEQADRPQPFPKS
jgi:hypothetical protein